MSDELAALLVVGAVGVLEVGVTVMVLILRR
jgi:hypothetical protein